MKTEIQSAGIISSQLVDLPMAAEEPRADNVIVNEEVKVKKGRKPKAQTKDDSLVKGDETTV